MVASTISQSHQDTNFGAQELNEGLQTEKDSFNLGLYESRKS